MSAKARWRELRPRQLPERCICKYASLLCRHLARTPLPAPTSGSIPATSFVTSHVRRRRLVQRHRKWQQSTKQFNKCRNHVKVLSKTFCSNDHVGGPGKAPNDTLPYTRLKCDTTRSPKLKFKSTHAQLSNWASWQRWAGQGGFLQLVRQVLSLSELSQ